MKQRYLKERFGENYFEKWIKNKKVFLNFPTGQGKTTLILDSFLCYCKSRGKKVLILCNRSLLEAQYHFDLAERYIKYAELKNTVEVMTYQRLGQILKNKKSLKNFLKEFDVVCCDECHFFYSDSEFNSFDTYVLSQVLLKECFFKTMIFMTATGMEVRGLFNNLYEKIRREYEVKDGNRNCYADYTLDVFDYNFENMANYDYVTPYFIEDVESLGEKIASSEGKTIVFIDDKKLANDFSELLLSTKKLDQKNIYILNSEILESKTSNHIIRGLVMGNRLETKVLITTSVLDNGVSIRDSEVENVIIATESRISFLQMLGRIRVKENSQLNLFVYPRSIAYYEKRVNQYQEKVNAFELAGWKIHTEEKSDLIFATWYQDDNDVETIKNTLVLTREEWEIFSENFSNVKLMGRGFILAVNEFARTKAGDMLLAERSFLKLSCKATEEVAKKQIEWIGKSPEELMVISSTFKEEMYEKLVAELMEIKNFTREQFGAKKTEIAKKYQKLLFPDLAFKGSSFENKKFEEVCRRTSVELCIEQDESGHNLYSVVKQNV